MAAKLASSLAILALLGCAGIGWMYLQADRATLELQNKLDIQVKDTDMLQDRCKHLDEDLQSAMEKAAEAEPLRDKLNQLHRDLDTLRAERDDLKNQIDQAGKEIEVAEAAAAQQDENAKNWQERYETLAAERRPADVADLESQIKDLQEHCAKLETIGAKQAAQIKDLTLELESAQQQLASRPAESAPIGEIPVTDSPPITHVPPVTDPAVTTPEPGDTTTPPTDGPTNPESVRVTNPDGTPDMTFQIVVTDEQYVVIDGGKDRDVQEGWVLYVFRDQELVGMLSVKSVEPNMALTEVMKDREGSPLILKTDKVRTINVPPPAEN